MKVDKGVLKKVKGGFRVVLPTKKGTADFAIPEAAQRFASGDAEDGCEVDVERDAANRIVKVTIPGKPERGPVAPPQVQSGSYGQRSGKSGSRPGPKRPSGGPSDSTSGINVRHVPKASPRVLGLPFHNPYTFLPFPEKPIERNPITQHSADELPGEVDRGRLTGILELRVTVQSPVMTCQAEPLPDASSDGRSSPRQGRSRSGQNPKAGHKRYAALTIGRDVIVPATGVRGSLRTLLTVLTGGTLGYINQHAYLCQGRDPSANLGPRGFNSPPQTPKYPFLAEVIRPGTAFRDGKVRLGVTRLIRLEELERCNGNRRFEKERDPEASPLWVGLDERDEPFVIEGKCSPRTPWRLKLSGRPINLRGKREGLFKATGTEITLPAELWAAYGERNAHGVRRELRAGDLVWLEPANPETEKIAGAADVRSIQWARWGRHGQLLRDRVPPDVLPDSMRKGGLVDEVTDLFGQVPERGVDTLAFAARVRTENLVLWDAAGKVQRGVTLAPLAPPHPGCIAFYRSSSDPDAVSDADGLRGYKVYRVQGANNDAPWLFQSQGVYDKQGKLERDPYRKVNKTVDLVPAGVQGTLRITFRGLTPRELALLVLASSVPWRLGGGKPLGLGLCRVEITKLLDEDGEPLHVSGWNISPDGDNIRIDGWQKDVQELQRRVALWEASQMPVTLLRYPRAVEENRYGKTRGGHAWFQRHAQPRKTGQRGDTVRQPGLEPMYIEGGLLEAASASGEPLDPRVPMISGQLLPELNAENPAADSLFGFDGYGAENDDRNSKRTFSQLEAFDPERHVTNRPRSEGGQGQDATSRQRQKDNRRPPGGS